MSYRPKFLDADVDKLVDALTIDEKISLLAGPDWWNTTRIDRLSIPSIRMSDGPNGVRGSSHFKSTPAQCLPCATALASSFDPSLVTKIGEFLAKEAKLKSATILLAPTCNIQRSPLGGRSFESFSEDPTLSGYLAAAYVSGLQSNGVGATIKHFVANEQEFNRISQDSAVSERALREMYLYPFMIAQRDSKPFAYMTSYNRLNGTHCSENTRLLKDILRGEWGFDGLVMSDWHGTYGTDGPINAGLDLEMPGPAFWRVTALVNRLIACKKVSVETLTERATKVVSTVQRLARLSPEVVYGDGEERTGEASDEVKKFCRQAAAEGIVLLKNDDVLPIVKNQAGTPLKVAVIGPNAKNRVISGGGSAFLKASYSVSPWEGLLAGVPTNVELSYSLGCYAHKYLPTLEDLLVAPSGEPGWVCNFYAHDEKGEPSVLVESIVLHDTRVKLNDFLPKGLTEEWSLSCRGTLKVDATGPFEFGLTVAGRAKLFVDGELLIDNWTKQRPGDFFYGQGTAEELGVIDLVAGKPVDILVTYTNTRPPASGELNKSQPALMKGVRLGGCPKIDREESLHDAATLAAQSDVAVVVVGLSSDWESEGFDRPDLSLPRNQDELVSLIAKANPKTVVCIQAGSATSMPWLDQVAGVVQAWYLGNESGNALADIIYGTVNPSGKLPITFPKREEDIAAHLNFGGGYNNVVHYREDIFVGYKHFDAHKITPLFPFGFGLSYTTFKLEKLKVGQVTEGPNFDLFVEVTVKNSGKVTGSEVVQLYVALPKLTGVPQPEKQLRAFAKVKDIKPGATEVVKLELTKYAVSYWNESSAKWRSDSGEYGIYVGTSSADLPLEASFTVKDSFEWSGL